MQKENSRIAIAWLCCAGQTGEIRVTAFEPATGPAILAFNGGYAV
ncbi:hypothetical protein [Methylocapsa palsarum]|uniref:Uncharacterized protein n=1 Tax=Methylocapsa palsarum TaxID=1612308 RepID=A0A1I4BRH7_9HYPH|nr:hypothetical protein [Methylocapsa palsarum]SFK71133.1 hypothetical protein SAMN05444581_11624 [Methylocapsa palsarum]